MAPFAFLTNHGLVLLCIAEDPRVRMRDIAATVQITERAAQRIVADLIEAGYVDRARDGRRNVYTVRRDRPITLPNQRDVDLNSLLAVLRLGSLGAQSPLRGFSSSAPTIPVENRTRITIASTSSQVTPLLAMSCAVSKPDAADEHDHDPQQHDPHR